MTQSDWVDTELGRWYRRGMVDAAQVVLLIVIAVLAILLVILGIQVFFILRELRATVAKANKVLDDTGLITESVSTPIATLSTLITGVKAGALIARILKKKKKSKEENDE